MGYVLRVALDMRSRRRPKQTVHPASNSKMKDTNVSQKPGAVLVFESMLVSFFISCFTNAKSAMSIANAMRVIRAAKNDIIDASNVSVMWVDKDRIRAMKATPAATGWTASPRVHELPIVMELLLLPLTITE